MHIILETFRSQKSSTDSNAVTPTISFIAETLAHLKTGMSSKSFKQMAHFSRNTLALNGDS